MYDQSLSQEVITECLENLQSQGLSPLSPKGFTELCRSAWEIRPNKMDSSVFPDPADNHGWEIKSTDTAGRKFSYKHVLPVVYNLIIANIEQDKTADIDVALKRCERKGNGPANIIPGNFWDELLYIFESTLPMEIRNLVNTEMVAGVVRHSGNVVCEAADLIGVIFKTGVISEMKKCNKNDLPPFTADVEGFASACK